MQQIEIEKKVKLHPHHIKQIEEKGIFVKEVQFRDTYFDRADFYLTTQNIWLRQRESQFELKIGVKRANGSIDRYEEITGKEKILTYLNLSSNFSENILDTFSHQGIIPFSSFTTQIRSYILSECSVAIDVANFRDLIYRVGEFEILVSNIDQVRKAEEKIKNILRQMEIDLSVVMPAKLNYYLYHKRQEHYKALIDHRVIQPIAHDIFEL